jgi:hypothetical protein
MSRADESIVGTDASGVGAAAATKRDAGSERLDIGQDSLRFLEVIASRNAAHTPGVLFRP